MTLLEHDAMHIAPPYRAALQRAGLSSVPAVVSCLGDRLVGWSRSSDVVHAALPGSDLSVYIKRYHYPRFAQRLRLSLRGGLIRASRARAEYRVLTSMRKLGIQAVRPIAFGERRVAGFLRCCFLVTEAVPESMSLSAFIQTFARRYVYDETATVRSRREVLTGLAEQVRFMHEAGFVHRDLFWRNVLIRPLPYQRFEFYFLDASVGRRIRMRQFRRDAIVRDLAALGVLAPDFCSRADQLRFIRAYLGTEHIRDEERQWMELVQERSRLLRETEHRRMQQESLFDHISRRAIGAT